MHDAGVPALPPGKARATARAPALREVKRRAGAARSNDCEWTLHRAKEAAMSKNLGELGTPIVVTAPPETTAARAAQMMRTHHVGSLVIVASGAASSRPLGIVTDRDLVLAVMAEGLDAALFTVGDIMSTQPVCADEQSSLLDAVALMREHSLRRLPVLDAAGRVVGVLTLEDVLDALAREFVDLTLALRAARDRERSQRR